MFGIWSRLDDIKDSKLKGIASSLPTLVSSAYAKSTLQKYKSAWKKWISWASQFDEVLPCPADPFFIAIYLNDIVSNDGKIGTLDAALLGIRWGHLSAGLETPTDNPIVKLALEGGKRVITRDGGKTSNQKEPLNAELLRKIVKGKNKNSSQNLKALHFSECLN